MSELITQEEITEEDYRAIEEAVMETARGRWFLKEYAKRNRVSDTHAVLDAVEGLKSYISRSDEPADVLQMRLDIVDMTHTIDQLKTEINSFDPQSPDGHFQDAQNQLGVVVDETEQATSSILSAAENVQQIAWEMRDEGGFPHFCDQLDALATDIYTSCSFQDLTGQRLRKVVDVTAFLEDRLRTMIAVWDDSQETNHTTGSGYAPYDGGLENGPAMPGKGQEQSDIDSMLSIGDNSLNNENDFDLGWADDEEDEQNLGNDTLIGDDAYEAPLVTTDLSLEPKTSEEPSPSPEASSVDLDNVDLDLTEVPEVSAGQPDLSGEQVEDFTAQSEEEIVSLEVNSSVEGQPGDETDAESQSLSVSDETVENDESASLDAEATGEYEQEFAAQSDEIIDSIEETSMEADSSVEGHLDDATDETSPDLAVLNETIENTDNASLDAEVTDEDKQDFTAQSDAITGSIEEASLEAENSIEEQLDTDIAEALQSQLVSTDIVENEDDASSDAVMSDDTSSDGVIDQSGDIDAVTEQASEEFDSPNEDQLDADIEALDGVIASEETEEEAVLNSPSLEDEIEEDHEDNLPLVQRQVMFS